MRSPLASPRAARAVPPAARQAQTEPPSAHSDAYYAPSTTTPTPARNNDDPRRPPGPINPLELRSPRYSDSAVADGLPSSAGASLSAGSSSPADVPTTVTGAIFAKSAVIFSASPTITMIR